MAVVNKVKTVKVKGIDEIFFKYYSNNSDIESNDLSDLIIREISEEGVDSFSITINNKNKAYNNLMIATEALPFCCGIREIGELNISKTTDVKDVKTLFDTLVTLTKGNTYIVNTNGNASSKLVDAALATSSLWTLVKTFKNSNSGSTIKMWISNND